MGAPDAHDQQVIIEFLTGSGDDSVKDGTAALAQKWVFERDHANLYVQRVNAKSVDTTFAKLKEKLAKLGPTSRVYIRGHGDWKAHTCAGLTGKDVAKFLKDHGLSPTVGLISVTACKSAIGNKANGEGEFMSLEQSAFSFTGWLHYYLGQNPNPIRTICHGRMGSVTVTSGDERIDMVGRKATYMEDREKKPIGQHPDKAVGHQTRSKVRFFWPEGGGKQMRVFVDYGPSANYDMIGRRMSKELWEPHA